MSRKEKTTDELGLELHRAIYGFEMPVTFKGNALIEAIMEKDEKVREVCR